MSGIKGLKGLLDFLHERIRSLNERMNEVIKTKLKPKKEKSYQALSSMKSNMRDRPETKRSRRSRRIGSESRHKSMRDSSKSRSRRMMRFNRFKSQYRDHRSLEPRNKSHGRALYRL